MEYDPFPAGSNMEGRRRNLPIRKKIKGLRIIAENTNHAPNAFEISDVDFYDLNEIGETKIRIRENPA